MTADKIQGFEEARRQEEVDARVEQQLELMLKQMPIGICLLDGPEHRYRFTNELYYALFGGHRDILGKSVREALPELAGTEIFPMLDNVYNTGKAFHAKNYTLELTQADGSSRMMYLDYSCEPFRGQSGDIQGILVTFIDVTEQVAARLRSEKVAAEFQALAELTPQMLFRADGAGNITYYNEPFYEYTGLTFDQLRDWGWDVIIHPNHLQRTVETWTESLRTGKPYSCEYLVKKHTGEYHWMRGRALPVRDNQGVVVAWMGSNQDVDDYKNLQKQLTLAKDAAESASAMKSSFLANMSHEIRTPLGAIMGFAELLGRGETTKEEISDFIQTIRRNSEHLLNLVNDILDLSKVESGKVELDEQRVALPEFLIEVAHLLRPRAVEKGLYVSLEALGAVPRYAHFDPTRVKQILINLIGNALKFTEKGGIRIEVAAYGSELRIQIADTGYGIQPSKIERLFEPFMQADSTTTRRFGGTGLGLALSRKLAEIMGGDLKLLKSELGVGSTFELTLPVRITSPEKVSSFTPLTQRGSSSRVDTSKGLLKGLKVLVVEDMHDNQRLIRHHLLKAGAELDLASDGGEGVALGTEKSYDVILMDIQMPVLDGYTATARLRESGFTGPILALTAHAMPEERQRCMDAGCNDILTKPLNFPQLIDQLSRFVPESTATPIDEDDEELKEIIQMFVDVSFPALMRSIEDGLKNRDRDLIARSAHSLMGSVAVLKEKSLRSIAVELEQEAKGSGRTEVMNELFLKLKDIPDKLRKFL